MITHISASQQRLATKVRGNDYKVALRRLSWYYNHPPVRYADFVIVAPDFSRRVQSEMWAIPSNLSISHQHMRFIDANIFIRHLANDHPTQSPACFALMKEIEQGSVVVWTTDLVIAEVVFVLSNKDSYNVGHSALRDMLLPLINLPGVKLSNKGIYRRAFDLYAGMSIDYIDAYNAALIESRKQTEIYSYDRHFDRIEGLVRVEP